MHLADGILSSLPVLLSFNACGAGGVAILSRRSLGEPEQAAWTGTLAAFVLALQAINLPLLPGTSAHALGAALLTLTLGPARAVLALLGVLVVQALLLADGGISVLGINALNLAVLPVLATHVCRRLFGESRRALMTAALVGTVLGSVAGALSLTLALAAGAQAPLELTAIWLIGAQAITGTIEGVLTAWAVKHLYGRAPALMAEARHAGPLLLGDPVRAPRSTHRTLKIAACALLLVLVLLPLASKKPDALEFVIERMQMGQ